jgi:poly(A) polymerase
MPRSENTFGTPAEDAFRRDITINGVFYNIADFSLVDYVGGLEDLHQGIIRCIGDPEEKFMHDPVRMIRVIRHAARTGFHIEEKTLQSLMIHAEKIRLCSPARVRDEFLRELREGATQESMHLMIESGMLFALFPPFRPFLDEPRQKEYFLNYLSLLNGKDLSHHPHSDDFSLALFLRPLAEFFIPAEKFPPGRRGQAVFQLKIREWMGTLLEPLQFKRHTQEATAQLLGFQRIFHEFSPYRRLPLRFQRNPHFPTAWYLFKLTDRARGEEIEQIAQAPIEYGILRKIKRRRRFRKKRFSGPNQSKNFPENIPQQ